MKKSTFARVFSLALMLVMLVSLASIGVSATPLVGLFEDVDNPLHFIREEVLEFDNHYAISVKSSDFNEYIQPYNNVHSSSKYRDVTMELAGIKLGENYLEIDYPWGDSVEIPAFPKNEEDYMDWFKYYCNEIPFIPYEGDTPIYFMYRLHQHNLQGSQMYFDDNYHWQLCTQCGNRAYLANHTDKDNDDKCDFCGNAIRYYNVTLKNVTGGKVTLSANKGAMGDKIKVTVTPDAGYHLDALNFVNNNAMHSKRAVWEDTPNAEYHFFVSNWDVEVEAIFVKD